MNYFLMSEIVITCKVCKEKCGVLSVTDSRKSVLKGVMSWLSWWEGLFCPNSDHCQSPQAQELRYHRLRICAISMPSKNSRVLALAAAEEDLTDLEDGEFYYHEIIGSLMFTKWPANRSIKEILQTRCQWCVRRETQRQTRPTLYPTSSLEYWYPRETGWMCWPRLRLDDEDWYF